MTIRYMDDNLEWSASVQPRDMIEDYPASSCSCSIAVLRYPSTSPRQILVAVVVLLWMASDLPMSGSFQSTPLR